MNDIEMGVKLDGFGPVSKNFTVNGKRDDPFVLAVMRALGDFGAPEYWSDTTLFHQIEGRGGYPEGYLRVDPSVTFGEIHDVLDGDEAYLTDGGWGGGDVWTDAIVSIGELLGWGLTIHGAIALAKDGAGSIQQLRYREERRLAGLWRDEGSDAIPMPLLQLVLARKAWDRTRFDFVFDLDVHNGSRLLRLAGYRRVSGDMGDIWIEKNSPDDLAKDWEIVYR